MNRFLFFVISICAFIAVPLIGRLDLLAQPEILFVILAVGILNFTQPALKKQEAKSNKGSDKNTVLFVVLATGLSISISVIDYAYFRGGAVEQTWWIAGGLLILFGLTLRAWAIRILGKYFTATVQIHSDHELITSGPYKLLRHPSYTGAAMAILGISLVLNSVVGFFSCLLLLGAAYYFRVSAEEKELKEFFGTSYTTYSRRTYRIIPLLW